MVYIGATLQQVQGAIQRGKMRFASLGGINKSFNAGLIDVRGAGTKRLTDRLALELARQWWNKGPGARISVGWIHSNAIRYDGDPPRTHYTIKVVSVPRPTTLWARGKAKVNHYGDPPKKNRVSRTYEDNDAVLSAFFNLVNKAIKKEDRRLRKVDYGNPHEIPSVEFWGNNGIKYAVSPLYVWPAGIITDDKMSNATNKVHNIVSRQQRKNNIKAYNEWREEMYKPNLRSLRPTRMRSLQTIKTVRMKARAARNALTKKLEAMYSQR